MSATEPATEPEPVRFGVNYLPGPAAETLRWAQAAEAAGFDIVGIADSQSVYRDVHTCLALCATGTRRVRLGPRVINPLTRHPAVAAGSSQVEWLHISNRLIYGQSIEPPP